MYMLAYSLYANLQEGEVVVIWRFGPVGKGTCLVVTDQLALAPGAQIIVTLAILQAAKSETVQKPTQHQLAHCKTYSGGHRKDACLKQSGKEEQDP